MELAALTGSVKQINWAQIIRRKRLKVWQGEDSSRFKAVESMLHQQGEASWWIANMEESLQEVCKVLDGGVKPKTPRASGEDAKEVSSEAVVAKQKPVSEGVVRTITATGFIQVGPTRDRRTGEIVVDDSLPF
ncbi:hypothetical protein Gbem_1747 [Citrifermentans bemidjiense Bem]|uniref:Uncharacterized protein n=1 Tax=Citrifermentans bemidjiense (strain ATCC BAA-1014 / DSM 16622 / JCM 12645 / Bem) TaxID=404380 RepID=B5EA57_CITBB|nr:hypothetical protein [Citrifermentans bemidjiense]ACH38763.1 hypothetical protein Gbem_1747 [Citrifermentans bemidjiense Bem]